MHVGDHVIERHREPKGPEELYVVLRGTAQFTLGEESFEAPVGTLVHAPPDTLREATALEPDTVVLAVGAKAGQAFTPSPWEDFAVAYAQLRAGNADAGPQPRCRRRSPATRTPGRARTTPRASKRSPASAPRPSSTCAARVAAGGDEVRTYAETDTDLDSLRDDPRYSEAMS